MKLHQLLAIGILILSLSSCLGDKKTVIGQEFGDTDFVNADFKGNKIEFGDLPKNMCEYLSESQISKLYPDGTKVLFDDGKTYMTKNCRFLVYIGEREYNYLGGTLFATEDIAEVEKEWVESWEMQKKLSKTSEYVSGLGNAAIWFGKKRELRIKMKGYTISITVPGSSVNEEESAKKRDYKNIAIKIAENTNLI